MFQRISKKFQHSLQVVQNNTVFRAIRKGLVMTIPTLMIGSFVLVLLNLPIPVFQDFLNGFLSGALRTILLFIYNGTFDLLSIIILLTISYSYAELKTTHLSSIITIPILSLGSFCIMSGFGTDAFVSTSFGVVGMFTAILTAIVSSSLFIKLRELRIFSDSKTYADGSDHDFNTVVAHVIPGCIVLFLFATANYILVNIFHLSSLPQLFSNLLVQFFKNMDATLFTGILYVTFVGLFWFFGIHGGNVLDEVAKQLFVGGVAANATAVAAGKAPTEILSKTFFDNFVFMDGAGATICLIIAILLFAKRKNIRNLAQLGIIPTIFNVNEFILFGTPVVYSPIFFLPFVLVPIVFTITSFLAFSLGLVPLITNDSINWTTPVFFSGYLTTGSIWGALLQLVNIVIGVLIYRPFIRLYERR
ncbi:MAG: PTS sugar transporter subunit IIC [Christensenellaceae bacterium]|jgi:lactose/cellobiose-specific phosphotransferase system IIC component